MDNQYKEVIDTLSSVRDPRASAMGSVLFEPINYYSSTIAKEGDSRSGRRLWNALRDSGLTSVIARLQTLISTGKTAEIREEEIIEAFGFTDRFWSLILSSSTEQQPTGERRQIVHENVDIVEDGQLERLAKRLDSLWWSFPIESVEEWRRSQFLRIVSELLILSSGSAYIYRKDAVARNQLTGILVSHSLSRAVARAIELTGGLFDVVSHNELTGLFSLSREVLIQLRALDEETHKRHLLE
jgi:hypothetical protein